MVRAAGAGAFDCTLACFALIRRWRATFPLEGEGFLRLCVALCGASQQWRSRLLAPRLGRGSLCGNGWWVRVNIGWWCRFAQDDTVGRRGVGWKTKCRIS